MKTFIYKLIYSATLNAILRPFAKLIYKLTKKKVITISGNLPVSIYGTEFTLATNQSCSVSQDLFFHGAENYEFTPLFAQLIKSSSVFFDVGANIGFFTVLGSKLNPSTSIFTFEPSKGPSHFVEQNIVSNNLKNVTLIKKAVAEIDGELTFYDVINPKYPWLEYNLNGSNSLQNKHGLEKKQSYNVQVTTLESIIEQYKLQTLDLLKLDTECTEHLILACSKKTIQQFQPIIICEVYDVIATELQNTLNELPNYQIFQYRNHILKKIENLQEVSSDQVYRNFIFCPLEKIDKLTLFIP